jgi:hypothetical protein
VRARQPARASALFVPARALEMSPRRTEGWSAVPEDRAMVFGLTDCRSASDNNGTKDSEATGRAHPLVHRFRTRNIFPACEPAAGKGGEDRWRAGLWREDCDVLGPENPGITVFCTAGRAVACAARRGQRPTVSESERPGVDTEQARSSRGALRCAIAR